MVRTLEDVANEVAFRAEQRPKGSHTVAALDLTVNKAGMKVFEEAAEVWEAALHDRRDDVISEMAQLWWRCLVLLEKMGLDFHDVIEGI